ncbi:hypothetical protein [Candidatus Nitrosotalea okcheonensis]|uniref:Uncharacterized protein n=1 Tax=Candidatus Nitrosotalea okcheonensis TaxID=1903276 RepID=A0A2H1FFB6_9ARCH|nr:hypothetical protein [Candidatus Nitrosotalea okcheonensis]MDE2588614.1 hypothetical protein [Patescibacteria group bacterium]SMH71369.1 protein of unknown function [Candidatus Nitrosotalea okcheonensis]
MNSLEYAIKKYAVDHYGDLIVPNKPVFDEKTKIWKSELRSTYPRIVEDEISGEILVGFLDLKDLGTIKFNDKLQFIDATPSDKCEVQLSSRLDLWKQQTERIVVIASSDVFAKIEESSHVLNPLELILDQLIATVKDNEIKILDTDVYEQRKPERIMEYLELLLELGIVRRVTGGYVHGNTYVGLLEIAKSDSRKLRTALLSHVIKQKYSVLRQVFGIRQLEPFVHLANAYYSASLEAERLIHMSSPHLYRRYQDFYKKITMWEFKSKLSELVDKGALHYDNEYLVGNKEYFDNMLKMKQEIQLNPMA